MPKFVSTKTYCHNEGLSCAFRQWRATHSHCSLVHGYAIQVGFVFEADNLDDKNWVVDFGGLKDIKAWLKDTFDHTMCVAEEDPMINVFKEHDGVLWDLKVLPAVGCEAFARYIYEHVNTIIAENSNGRCRVRSVEVREHGANSAIYEG